MTQHSFSWNHPDSLQRACQEKGSAAFTNSLHCRHVSKRMRIFSILISRRCLIDTWIYPANAQCGKLFPVTTALMGLLQLVRRPPNHMSNKERVYLWGWHEWMVMTVYSKAEEDGAWHLYSFFFFFSFMPLLTVLTVMLERHGCWLSSLVSAEPVPFFWHCYHMSHHRESRATGDSTLDHTIEIHTSIHPVLSSDGYLYVARH